MNVLRLALPLLACLVASASFAGNWNAQTHDVYSGRFNNDARTDLLVIARDPAGFSGIFVSDGSGTPSVQLQSWNSTFLGIDWSAGNYAVVVGNFDGLNGDDVLLQGIGAAPSHLLLSDANGTLYGIQQTMTGWGTDAYRMVAGDFNGDGRKDVFLQARLPSGTNYVMLADATGRLTVTAHSWSNAHLGMRWSTRDAIVHVGDFNGDGRDDLLLQARPTIALIDFDVPIPIPVFSPQSFALALSSATGQFTSLHQLWSRRDFSVDWAPNSADLVIGDFNGDGRDDVMLVARAGGQASHIMVADGNGQFSSGPSQTLTPGVSGTNWSAADYRFTAGDFNGDGRTELYRQAVATNGANSIVSFTSGATVSAVGGQSPPTVSGGFSYSSKLETRTYHDNLGSWVLGLVASSTTNGTESLHVDFNANALPLNRYEFGALRGSYTYWSYGLLNTVTDANNHVTTAETYSRGIPTLIRFADNTTQSVGVDDNGWVRSITNERSAKTCYDYDVMERLSATTYPSESQNNVCDASTWTAPSVAYIQLTAAELGMPAGTWRQRETQGRIQSTRYYDGLLRVVLVEEKDTTTAKVVYRRTAYDDAGRVTFESYPSATSAATAGINTEYDAIGRVRTRSTTDGVTLETAVYLSDNRVQLTDADNRTTTTTYQAFDEPVYRNDVRVSAPENLTKVVARDVFGKPLAVTQSGNWSGGYSTLSRRFEYDVHQRPCRRIDPERGATVWGYDAAGRTSWEAKGQSGTGCLSSAPSGATQFVYDSRDRKTLDDYSGTGEDVVLGYDVAGNLTSVSNAAAVWTYGYNKRGLLESEQVAIDGLTRLFDPAYNALGQLNSMTTPAHAISYAPDAWGRPTQLGSYITSIDYHPNGLPSSFIYGNGLTYSQSLDSRQRPYVQATLDGGTAIQRFVYGYFPSGQLQTIDDQVNNTDDLTATYDGLHRLATATGLWGTYGYTYDTLNNLRARSGPSALSYSYNGSNQLSGVSGGQTRSYSYNARGDVTGDGANAFTLNSKGQIGGITGVATYAYDGNAKRIKTVQGGASEYTMYSHAGGMMFVEKGTQMTDQLALGGQIIVELKKVGAVSTPTYLHPDALGSPRAATTSAKNVLWRETYDPYGVKLNGVPDKVGYTGHAHDWETGYTYMQARFYDAQVGRFLSTDPVDDGFNLYAYVGNDPLNAIDPTGAIGEATAVGCALTAAVGCAPGAAIGAVIDVAIVAAVAITAYVATDYIMSNKESAPASPDAKPADSSSNGPSAAEQPAAPSPAAPGNTNPYSGPVDAPVTVIDSHGNAIPVSAGEEIAASPNGDYQQVRDKAGNPTGVRLDRGGHRTHADPSAKGPHGHVPGVTQPNGNPHLPIKCSKPAGGC
ncbi:RHS repeat domain-containing protein [Peristeroidobacter soli]|uniref:RHS repeat domain-containing protein n=1 Tax=Peristeroidobacter soli TaxID=2497877 RepID=UPI00158E8956|nr:RHS repeat-associated core domain-containing protein [Peristeroidobacter soli]